MMSNYSAEQCYRSFIRTNGQHIEGLKSKANESPVEHANVATHIKKFYSYK